VDDLQESLEENVPWDPPTEDIQVPTRSEARGTAAGGGGDALADDAASTTKSLPDLSPEELSRAAHPQAPNEETA